MQRTQQPRLHLLALVLGCLASCSSSPRFYGSRLVASEYDEANAATRVTVSFEVWNARNRPINDLDTEDLTVLEDGVFATSESSVSLSQTKHPITVLLLLDRSASARAGEDGGIVKATAQALLDGLARQPCEVQVYAFANTVQKLSSLDELAKAGGEGDVRSRWTALYHAIDTVLNEHGLLARSETPVTREGEAPESPSTVLVVCSDGADNYSQN